jgi:hypothetical protein
MPRLIERHPIVDEVLAANAEAFGADRAAYEGHAMRVLNFCAALAPQATDVDTVAIASAFHDIAVWPDGNLDYLGPSAERARQWLAERASPASPAAVSLMIELHHKLTPYKGEHATLVEPYRRADLVDVSVGLVRFGLPGEFVREVRARFPNAGFHRALARVIGGWLPRHPTRPFPILRF